MITVRCICSNKLEVPTDLAGDSIQCPRCGHLVDVPLLSELDAIEDDGSYRISEEPAPEPHRLAELARIYAPGRKDNQGRDIDLRTPAGPRPPAGQAAPNPVASNIATPIYDPDTGRRIEPLELADNSIPLPQDIPMARMNLSYATAGMAKPRLSLFRILLELLHPINLFVMGFLLVGHFANVLVYRLANSGAWLIELLGTVLLIPVGMIVTGHYGVVIEETGPEEKGELPRPLRNVSMWDDVILPGMRVLRAMLICFAPVIIYWRTPSAIIPNMPVLIYGLTALALFIMPVVLILSVINCPLSNYVPRQLLRLIRQQGIGYLATVFLGFLCYELVLWVHGVGNPMLLPRPWLAAIISLHIKLSWLGFVDLAVMVYLLHAMAFRLGTVYHQLVGQVKWTTATGPRSSNRPLAPAHPPVSQASARGPY